MACKHLRFELLRHTLSGMKQHTIMLVAVILIILAAAIAGATYFSKDEAPTLRESSRDATSTLPADDETVFCTQEAKQCPDGSYVGRTGPNCEFAPCP